MYHCLVHVCVCVCVRVCVRLDNVTVTESVAGHTPYVLRCVIELVS